MILRILTYYLYIGIVFGIGNFFLAKKLFNKHPNRDDINWQTLFQLSLVRGIISWPVDLLMIFLTVFMKLGNWYRRSVKRK